MQEDAAVKYITAWFTADISVLAIRHAVISSRKIRKVVVTDEL